MQQNTTIKEMIDSLEKTSETLATYADDPKNYNSEYAHMLYMISLDMRSNASSLKEYHYHFGDI